jgi:1-acyl-sn-glycerol-3-phosphate acyltransferase
MLVISLSFCAALAHVLQFWEAISSSAGALYVCPHLNCFVHMWVPDWLVEWLILLLFNLLKPVGFFTYHQVWLSKILRGARFALSVLYSSQNKQPTLLYMSLTEWFL